MQINKGLLGLLTLVSFFAGQLYAEESQRNWREVFADLIVADDEKEASLVEELSQFGDPEIAVLYESWRTGDVYALKRDDQSKVLQHLDDDGWIEVSSGATIQLTDAEIESLSKLRASRGLRRTLSSLMDTLELKSPDPDVRKDSARKLGLSQNDDFLPALRERLQTEQDPGVIEGLNEGIAISLLENGSPNEVLDSVRILGEIKSVAGRDFVQKILEEETAAGRTTSELAIASSSTLKAIQSHMARLEFFGNFVRGLSLGSVLLIVAFGLAITFGLMGIINMAHGEFVAIGGYTAYLVQNAFIAIWGIESTAFGWYFLVSLPVSFLVAALIGLGLEKAVIQFLYRRPLESLLCTWGLSMVMQQTFRLIFGAANVQVNNPSWLMGNTSIGGLAMSDTRLFIVFIALLVIVFTWLLLQKTHLGLHIRAVMQNREMAGSLGIPVKRVNSLTFALGCGLAAIGGAVLSQLGNVGPSMGQAYIVDCFMVVVIGGVGNLLGAGISAMGIGMLDQNLQPYFGPVMGKITVYFAIILFLQWRPGGLFPTRSRSLED